MPVMVIQFIVIVLAIWFVISQITLPMAKETKLFPMFRVKKKVLDSLNVELNQEIEYTEKLSEIKNKVKRKVNKQEDASNY